MAFDIPYELCVIVMAVLTCAYVILGGYMATAINDFIQGIVMLAGIVAGPENNSLLKQLLQKEWK